MASISSVTPFLLICVSSSATASSNVKPYWKPEQPPPCTNTRSFSSGLPSSSTSSLTLAAALSVKTSGPGISVVAGDSSATALMGILAISVRGLALLGHKGGATAAPVDIRSAPIGGKRRVRRSASSSAFVGGRQLQQRT